jgi:FkbM family methyltransferase
MNAQIKQMLKKAIFLFVAFSGQTRFGRYLLDQLLATAMETMSAVSHNGLELRFVVPNLLSRWRAATFSTKEPETLEWIETIPKNSIVWDVGANIGLYSVYAAKKRNCRVWAFEPSVFNLELLARNIFLNGVTKQVCIVPIALSNRLGSNFMRLTTTEWGGALSSFGENFGWDGKVIKEVFEFQTMGISMEDVIHKLAIPAPDFIKMDVDGLEHFMLRGGSNILRTIKGILIEVNDDFHEQAGQCHSLLSKAGLRLKEKRHSDYIASSTHGFQNSYNQIWCRD